MPLQHQQIKRMITQRIGQDWKPGDRLPPINQLARRLGVGENNAYRAVRELCEEGVLSSRPRRGTMVTSRPTKPSVKPAVRKRVYVPLSVDREGLIQRMARATIEELRRRGREVVIVPDPYRVDGIIELRGIDADAVVLINQGKSKVLIDDGMVVSLIETAGLVPAAINKRYDLVSADDEQGGFLAGECLRQFGLMDVAFIGVRDKGGGYSEVDQKRLDGFERGLGHAVPPARRMYVNNYSWDAGARIARDYAALTTRPDAVFASTDDIAIGFAVGGTALGLEPRRDYHLVGFDGQSGVHASTFGGITTVAVAAEGMGRQAAEFLDMRLDHPDLPPRSMSLGCAMRRGKTTPKPTEPHHPFFERTPYWPAPPDRDTP